MKTFFDSSAFAKRYLEEAGSAAVESLCLAASDLAVCVICVPEILSALNRRVRERHISSSDYLLLKGHLLDDLRDAAIVNLAPAPSRCSRRHRSGPPTRCTWPPRWPGKRNCSFPPTTASWPPPGQPASRSNRSETKPFARPGSHDVA